MFGHVVFRAMHFMRVYVNNVTWYINAEIEDFNIACVSLLPKWYKSKDYVP